MKWWIFLATTLVVLVSSGLCRHNKVNNSSLAASKGIADITSFKYYTKARDSITIPVMFHIDKTLTKTLFKKYKSRRERSRFKTTAKSLLKDVEGIFDRPSLNQTLNLVFLDLQVLKNKQVEQSEDISKYLRSYCQWQGRMKAKRKRWYYSVLLTGLDFYYIRNGAKVRLSAGRSYVGSVCSTYSSCSLVEWHPKHTANLLAHEIAHSLGLPHDGLPNNNCKGRYIMEPKYYHVKPANTWSPCSKRELYHFMKSKHAWCLQPFGTKLQRG